MGKQHAKEQNGYQLASGFRAALAQADRWHEKSAFDLEG
jgi:hypothetical protein